MSAKHTPGPWIISGVSINDGSISVSYAEYRIVIAQVTNAASFGDFVSAAIKGRRDFGAPDTAATQWANARLIASAPDMLAALKEAEGELYQVPPADAEQERVLAIVRAAISKAEGQ